MTALLAGGVVLLVIGVIFPAGHRWFYARYGWCLTCERLDEETDR